MFTRFFNWLKRAFATQQALLQLAIQSIVGEFLKAHPRFKAPLQKLYVQVVPILQSGAVPLANVPALLKSKIDLSGLLPPEQALALIVIDQVTATVNDYIAKAKIVSASDQIQAVILVLGWINDMAKL